VSGDERRQSSRRDLAGAGWECAEGSYRELMSARRRPFSWLSPAPLWRSRNDRLARRLGDPTDERRQAWMDGLGDEELTVELGERSEASFLLVGDTGEGDSSQYATVLPLRSQAAGADFLFIASDVIYPAGGIDEYGEKFARPYKDFAGGVYAIPGNHDWYDDATGFMYWFCGRESAPPRPRQRPLSKAWIRDRLWRKAPKPGPDKLRAALGLRARPSEQPNPQPGLYFALDTGPVVLVGIDTGIRGNLDRRQGAWLRRVSAATGKPKILITGKPIYVDGEHRPGEIAGGGTVDEVVTAPEHNYVAAIGGDIHNYQRYPIELAGERTLLYLVSGGGGAFMHETHTVPDIDRAEGMETSEARFRCYPLRGDSLSRFSQLYARKMRWVIGPLWRHLHIAPDVAAKIMSERLGIAPTRDQEDVRVRARDRFAARLIFAIHHRGRGALHLPFSEWLDWNQPPMFKQFLRIDADASRIRIRCFAATGCRSQEDEPPLEDDLLAERHGNGNWTWTLPDRED